MMKKCVMSPKDFTILLFFCWKFQYHNLLFMDINKICLFLFVLPQPDNRYRFEVRSGVAGFVVLSLPVFVFLI